MSHLTLGTNSMSSSATSVGSGTIARTRKSTLTQQQKNKKRQRATPGQLVILKREFEINNTPNAKTREEIGKKIDMTERSVQIWFQNKRAKQKLFSRKNNVCGIGNLSPLGANMNNGYFSGSSNSPIDSCHSTPSGAGYSNRGFAKNMLLSPYGGNYSALSRSTSSLDIVDGNGRLSLHGYSNFGAVILFSCSSLTIGSWRRIASPNPSNRKIPDDLIVLYSPSESKFTYLMFDGTTRFKMEFPAKSVDKITLLVDENNPMIGIISLQLNNRPSFSVKTPKAPERWLVCGDFSVAEQASKFTTHKLTGPYNLLHGQTSQLYSFQPSKVSAGLLTPPQTATSYSIFERNSEIGDVVGYGQRNVLKDSHPLLPIPERSQTRSTPAVFINLPQVTDPILEFGETISDDDLNNSSLERDTNDDFTSQTNDNESNTDPLFSKPSQMSWNNFNVAGNEMGSEVLDSDEFFHLKVESPPVIFTNDNVLGLVSPDSDDFEKKNKGEHGIDNKTDEVDRLNQVVPDGLDDPFLIADSDSINSYMLEGGTSFQTLGDDFDLSYGDNFL